MKIREILSESLTDDARYSLPGAFVLPGLQNSDAYKQYRYGLALASAAAEREGHDKEPFERASPWAENLAVIGYTSHEEEIIRLAAKMMGVDVKEIAPAQSQECPDVNKASPVAKRTK